MSVKLIAGILALFCLVLFGAGCMVGEKILITKTEDGASMSHSYEIGPSDNCVALGEALLGRQGTVEPSG